MNSNKALTYFLIILIILLLGGVGYVVFLLLNDAKNDTDESNTQQQEEVIEEDEMDSETEEADEEIAEETIIPEGWSEQVSDDFGYTIGVPEGWYFRFFSSTRMIGMDPNPIPEASEYAGAIVFIQDERTLEAMVSNIESSMENSTNSEVEVNGITWTQISGELSGEDFFNPGQEQVHSLVSQNGLSYRLTLVGSSLTGLHGETYKQVLETIQFSGN